MSVFVVEQLDPFDGQGEPLLAFESEADANAFLLRAREHERAVPRRAGMSEAAFGAAYTAWEASHPGVPGAYYALHELELISSAAKPSESGGSATA